MAVRNDSGVRALGLPELLITWLGHAGVTTVDHLTRLNSHEVLDLFNVGALSLERIEARLGKHGLALSTHPPTTPLPDGRIVKKEIPLTYAAVRAFMEHRGIH
jgi:DNA-directed RNA polymerase alpha subunit